ncbi:hypothetical protein Pmani_031389 [Petrolisthes manimaculis]|uniref:Uncharacterized protein n=1 Tax=Petrolisthes manimaculis TaxID=1843537 RepID=A0AAE1NVS3_9EUCA|nr:hypothetical protein Pmani_031389 [Petrolisthes manimaculis]
MEPAFSKFISVMKFIMTATISHTSIGLRKICGLRLQQDYNDEWSGISNVPHSTLPIDLKVWVCSAFISSSASSPFSSTQN